MIFKNILSLHFDVLEQECPLFLAYKLLLNDLVKIYPY